MSEDSPQTAPLPIDADPLSTLEVSTNPATPEGSIVVPHLDGTPNPEGGSPESFTEAMGMGADGEVNVWEARYSMKNFIGRLMFWGVLTILCAAMAVWVTRYGHRDFEAVPLLLGIGLAFAWIMLIRRIVLARFGHYYRLTNRRMFVSTGVFKRRRDQLELVRVNDVYTSQTLVGRWFSVGNVVVVSKEPQFPIMNLIGVNDPKTVMDLVWHHARLERDRRTVKVDQV